MPRHGDDGGPGAAPAGSAGRRAASFIVTDPPDSRDDGAGADAIAHELRNAVGALQSAVQVLRQSAGSELGDSAMDVIERQLQRLVALLPDWQHAARRTADVTLPDVACVVPPDAAGGDGIDDVFSPEPMPTGAMRRCAVLLERDPQRLRMLRHRLEASRYRVLCALEPTAALRLVLSQQPDTIVASIAAGGAGALDFSRRCRAAGYTGQMIAVVEPTDAQDAHPLRRAGYDAALAWPLDEQRLQRLLRGEE